MSVRAEVMIGKGEKQYLADVELLLDGSVILTIKGMSMTERLFEAFVRSNPTISLVEFKP